MEPPQTLYNQDATHFVLSFYIRPEVSVPGAFMLELANTFLKDLLFPGCRPALLDTKLPGEGRELNMGDFSERRWNAAVKKLLGNQYAVLGIKAHTLDFPNQKIWLNVHVNPPGGDEFLDSETIAISCSVSYLRHIAASPQKIDALLQFGKRVWNGIERGPAYGFGNLAITLMRPPFDPFAPIPPGTPFPRPLMAPPGERVHAIPIAYGGTDIDGNLSQLYVKDRGIKGAFWTNYLSAAHVALAGGTEQLRGRMPGIRVEPLDHGGLMVVATDSPLPEDSDENRRRFTTVHGALQPAFLSREATTPMMRPLLGYFFREAKA